MKKIEKRKKILNKNFLIGILLVLIVLLGGYILINKYNEMRLKKDLAIFQKGMKYGYEQAIIKIIKESSMCNEVPLYVGNKTINIIAVGCLKGGEKNESS